MSISNISFLTLFEDGANLEIVRGNTHTFVFSNLKTKTGDPYNYSWNLRAYNDDPKLGAISQSDSGTLVAGNQSFFNLTLDFPGNVYLLNSVWTLALQLEDPATNQVFEGGQVTITISKDSVDNAGQEIINNLNPGNLIRSTTLTGLNTGLTGAITATDTILTGFGRVQNQIDTALTSKENTIAAGTTSQYYRGDKTFQTLDKTAVGLANVDNTSDLNKPLSTAAGIYVRARNVKFLVGPQSWCDYVTDGTDDHVQINQAITDANIAGGGTVQLIDGTFSGATITLKSNVSVIGSAFTTYNAKNSSISQVVNNTAAADNFNLSNIFLNANSSSYGIILSSFTNAYLDKVKISNSVTRAGHFEEGTNIKVTECEARLTAGEGLIFYTNLRDSWLVNNLVDGATSYGLRASGGGQNNLVAGNTIMNGGTGIFMRSSIDKFVRIVHNNIINCTNGIELNSNSTTTLNSKALVANNVIEGKTATGVGIDLTVTAGVGNNRDHVIVNNQISNFAIGYRQLTNTLGIADNIVSGNKIMNCSAQAMVLYNSDSQINNNLIDTASTGIDIYSGSNWNTIVGNKILGVTTGIQERTGANYNNIQCNTVNASGTKISKTGVNSVSANNLTN